MAVPLKFLVCALFLPLALAGCTTKANSDARAKAAFIAGRQAGMQAQAQAKPQVSFVGNVQTPVIPWENGLTLSRALNTAVYQGARDPVRITIYRPSQADPILVDPQSLLRGEDFLLNPGDRIDVR